MIYYLLQFYKNVNYTIYDINVERFKTPLYISLSLNRFSIVSLLLKNGADINYEIENKYKYPCNYWYNSYNFINKNNLNCFIDNEFKLSSGLMVYLIENNKTWILKKLFNNIIYDSKFIIKLILMHKNKVIISDQELINIIIEAKRKIKIPFSWLYTAVSKKRTSITKLFLNHFHDKSDIQYNPLEIYILLKESLINSNDSLIKIFFDLNVVDCNHYTISKLFLHDILTLCHHKKTTINFIKRLFKDKSLDLKINSELNDLTKFSHFDDYYLLKWYTPVYLENYFNHPTFEKRNLIKYNNIFKNYDYKHDFISIFIDKFMKSSQFDLKLNSLDFIINKIDYKRYSQYIIIHKYINHPLFDTKYVNFERVLYFFCNNYNNNYHCIKSFIKQFIQHKTFNIKNINIKVSINHLKNLDRINYDNHKSYLYYFLNILLKSNNFHFASLPLDEILAFLIKRNNFRMSKIFIDGFLNHESCNFMEGEKDNLNIKTVLLNIKNIRIDDNENGTIILNYFINKVLHHQTLDLNSNRNIENILLAANKLNNLQQIQYIIKTTFDLLNNNYNNNKNKNYNRIDDSNNKINNGNKINNYSNKNKNHNIIKNNSNSINKNNRKSKNNKINNKNNNNNIYKLLLDINNIDIEKIILSSINHNNLYMIMFIFNNLIDHDDIILNKLNIEKYLLVSSKSWNIKIMEFLIDHLYTINNEEGLEESKGKLSIKKISNTSYLSLILNVLIKIGSLNQIQNFIKLNPKNFNINSKDKNKENALKVSFYSVLYHPQGIHIFKYILKYIDIDNVAIDEQDDSLFLLALKHENYLVLQELLNHQNIIQNIINNEFLMNDKLPMSEIEMSILVNDKEKVETIQKQRLIPNGNHVVQKSQSKHIFPPLILSYLTNNQNIFMTLLEYSDINQLDNYGYNILDYAILKEDIPLVQKLINMNMNTNLVKNSNYNF